MKKRRWYSSGGGIARMGPYRSELVAYRALNRAPQDARTRIVMTNPRAPDLGLTLVSTPAVLDGTLVDGARVWSEQ